jgi:hypothetical protein
LFQDVWARCVEIESHVVEPFEVASRGNAVLLKESKDIPFVNEFRNEVFAFASLDRSELFEDGVGEDIETTEDDREGTFQRLTRGERTFNETCPADLNSEDDELSGIRIDPGEESFTVETFGRSVESFEIGVGASEELSERDFHLGFEFRKPVVDLGVFREDDRSREGNFFTLTRRHSFDAGVLLVEGDRRKTGEHLLEELADSNDL